MSLKDFDAVDRKILAELDKNARVSYSELGKRIRVAKETVKYRIAQLQARGVIKGFYTVINFSRLGFSIYRIYLRLQDTTPEAEEEIIGYLLKSDSVAVAYRVNGPYHLALGIWARDQWEFGHFWTDFRGKFGSHFNSVHISVMTEYSEFSRPYLFPSRSTEKAVFTTITRARPEKVDALDFQLLAFISNNARASLVDIAGELDVSVVTARYRLKNLVEKGAIVGFRPILDLQTLGQEYYKVDLWLRDFTRMEEIVRHVRAHPNTAYAERTLISGDVEFDLEIGGFDHFTAVMEDISRKFPGAIRDYTYYSLVKNYKFSYVPVFGQGKER